jgi:hypothetical protein
MERKFVEKEGSYSYSEVRACTWFYTGIVNERQLFPLCGQGIPSIMIPGDFAVPFRVNIPEEEIIVGLGKDRPWGLRTYRPFRGQLQDAKPSFKEKIRFAEKVIDETGMPMSPKTRGRRRKYDWKGILAALLCKGVSPFSDLERELRDTGYCKVDGRTPCDSELHYVYSKIPEDWLDNVTRLWREWLHCKNSLLRKQRKSQFLPGSLRTRCEL